MPQGRVTGVMIQAENRSETKRRAYDCFGSEARVGWTEGQPSWHYLVRHQPARLALRERHIPIAASSRNRQRTSWSFRSDLIGALRVG